MQYSPYDLLLTQLELECKGLDARGDLVRIDGANPDPMNRFHVVRLPDRYLRIFRHDVPSSLRRALERFSDEDAFTRQDEIRRLVGETMGPADSWIGRTYVFESEPDPSAYPDVVRRDDGWCILVRGEVVSRAMSARQNGGAAEVGVETAAGHRRRGFGRQVTAAWASAMLEEGRLPFYGHVLDNGASERLARSLGLAPQFDFAGY